MEAVSYTFNISFPEGWRSQGWREGMCVCVCVRGGNRVLSSLQDGSCFEYQSNYSRSGAHTGTGSI